MRTGGETDDNHGEMHARRLAQRMHDDLCQQLAAAVMWQGLLIRQLEGVAAPSRLPEKTVEQAWQVSRLLNGALTEARALMKELRGDDAV